MNSIVQEIARLQLMREIKNSNIYNFNKMKKVVWGAGISGKNFIKTNINFKFHYIVDSRAIVSSSFMGIPIFNPNILEMEDRETTIIFTPTVISYKVTKYLKKLGFKFVIIPAQIKTGGIQFSASKEFVLTGSIFKLLNKQNVSYTTFKEINLDELIPGKDIDLFINPANLPVFLDANLNPENSNDTIELDVSWSSPIGLHNELLLFPKILGVDFLLDKNNYKNNKIKVVNDYFKLIKAVYGILIHKGSIDVSEPKKKEFNNLVLKNGLFLNLTLQELQGFLKSTEYFPKVDFINKWNAVNMSEYWRSFLKFEEPIGLIVFVFREIFSREPKLFRQVRDIIKQNDFIEKKFRILNNEESKIVVDHFRGGVWLDSYQSAVAGLPWAIGIYEGSFGDMSRIKDIIRKHASEMLSSEINVVHSSDNQLEAEEYLSALGLKLL